MSKKTLLFDDAGTVVRETVGTSSAFSRLGNGFIAASRSEDSLGLAVIDQDGEELVSLRRPELELDSDELELVDVIGDPMGESFLVFTTNRELGGVLAERFDCVP